jgi:hypothetical protein
MKIHLVFYITLLELVDTHQFPQQVQLSTLPVIIDSEKEWKINDILDSWCRRGKLQDLVDCNGYDYPIWEPLGCVTHAWWLNKRFHIHFPSKPKLSNINKHASDSNLDWHGFRLWLSFCVNLPVSHNLNTDYSCRSSS